MRYFINSQPIPHEMMSIIFYKHLIRDTRNQKTRELRHALNRLY